MASIDAFFELAANDFAPAPRPRASSRFVRVRHDSGDPRARRERRWIVAFVLVVDALLLLALSWAMRPAPVLHQPDDRPLRVLIEWLPPPLPPVLPAPARVPKPPVSTQTPPRAARPAVVPPSSALQAVWVPRAPPPAPAAEVRLFGVDGRVQVPSAPMVARPRDLLERRDVSHLLPGLARPPQADFHVDTRTGAQKAVQAISALTGGGPVDPCPELRRRMANVNDPNDVDDAERRYEVSCGGQ